MDFLSKVWAISRLKDQPPIHIIGDFLQLTFITNSGAAFSLATNATLFLSSFALIVSAGIIYFAWRITSTYWGIALGLVLGGIFGNLFDRIFREPYALKGRVVDWIELTHWPVFNLADMAIVSSACFIAFLSVKNIVPMQRDKS